MIIIKWAAKHHNIKIEKNSTYQTIFQQMNLLYFNIFITIAFTN